MNCKLVQKDTQTIRALLGTEALAFLVALFAPNDESQSSRIMTGLGRWGTFVSRLGLILKARNTALNFYGSDFFTASEGNPGSFVVRYPIISFFVPFVVEASSWSGIDYMESKCASQPAELGQVFKKRKYFTKKR